MTKMQSHRSMIEKNRDWSYKTFGQDAILYPPTDTDNAIIYVIKSLYLSIPYAFTHMESRLNGSETHLSMRLRDTRNFTQFTNWQIFTTNQLGADIFGVIDAVFVDDSMGEINVQYNLHDNPSHQAERSSKSTTRGAYL